MMATSPFAYTFAISHLALETVTAAPHHQLQCKGFSLSVSFLTLSVTSLRALWVFSKQHFSSSYRLYHPCVTSDAMMQSAASQLCLLAARSWEADWGVVHLFWTAIQHNSLDILERRMQRHPLKISNSIT